MTDVGASVFFFVQNYRNGQYEKEEKQRRNKKRKEVKDEKIYTSFYDFMEDQIEKRNLNEATKKTQRRTLSVLKEFKKELLFKDIDVIFLMNFQRYIELKGLELLPLGGHKS